MNQPKITSFFAPKKQQQPSTKVVPKEDPIKVSEELPKEAEVSKEKLTEEIPEEVPNKVSEEVPTEEETKESNVVKVFKELNVIAEVNKVKVVAEDITKIKVDAIVNAAKESLLGGGGVDGAIHRAAGPELLKACKQLNGCKTGEAKITDAYNIKDVKAIIHTVGPRAYYDVTEEKEEELYNCYINSLLIAAENNIRTIAFPTISTGIYGYPKDAAAEVATAAVKDFLEDQKYSDKIDEVYFCVYGKADEDIYKKLLPVVFE